MNPFQWLYDWLFVNKSIDEQYEMYMADMVLLDYYKKISRRDRKLNSEK